MFIHGYSWFREAFRYNTHVHSCACVVYYLTIVNTPADRAGCARTVDRRASRRWFPRAFCSQQWSRTHFGHRHIFQSPEMPTILFFPFLMVFFILGVQELQKFRSSDNCRIFKNCRNSGRSSENCRIFKKLQKFRQ